MTCKTSKTASRSSSPWSSTATISNSRSRSSWPTQSHPALPRSVIILVGVTCAITRPAEARPMRCLRAACVTESAPRRYCSTQLRFCQTQIDVASQNVASRTTRHRGPSRPAIMGTSSPWPGWRCSAWCSIGPFVATTGCNRLPGGLSAGAQVLAHGRADHLGDTGALFGGSQEQVTLEVRIQAHRLDRGSRRAHGRAARLATLEDLIDVVALLGLVSHRLDHLVGDRGAIRWCAMGSSHVNVLLAVAPTEAPPHPNRTTKPLRACHPGGNGLAQRRALS